MWMLSEFSERNGAEVIGVFKKVENAMLYAQEDSGIRTEIQWTQPYGRGFKGEVLPGKGWLISPVNFMDRLVER